MLDPAPLSRRQFVGRLAAGAAGLVGAAALPGLPLRAAEPAAAALPAYRGPNVILIRFGGGVRRQEVLQPSTTWAPWFLKELAPRGTLYSRMEISQFAGDPAEQLDTSHGQGTLYILTGRYARFRDIEDKLLGARFEATVPTLFEYLRAAHDIAPHEALLVNGEDRTDEEFYTFSNHHLYGHSVRGEALSLFRFKAWKLRQQLAADTLAAGPERRRLEQELAKMEAIDYRAEGGLTYAPRLHDFWRAWQDHYGADGYVNPRGDALLTELSVQAMRRLQPRLLMINYQDPDYVHWGNPNHYTAGIRVIDAGIRRLVETVNSLDAYRDNTLFVIVPDCGRDANPLMRVPYQHHFNSASSREIFCLVVGPRVPAGRVIDRPVNQVQVAATIGAHMGIPTDHCEGEALREAFS